jgi:hypothetical protein
MEPSMRYLIVAAACCTAMSSHAQNVTYTQDIRPLWERQCMACHGATSPGLAEFNTAPEKFTALSLGPRMDSYASLIMFTGWPDTGALMRRLDDGKNTKSGKPGNMYEKLGADEGERQKNLALFKKWVGAWFLGRPKDLDIATLNKIQVLE